MFIFNHLPGHIVDELLFKITVILQIKNDTYYKISNRYKFILYYQASTYSISNNNILSHSKSLGSLRCFFVLFF